MGAGQIGLGHDAHEAAARHHGGAVEDASAHAHGEAHGDESVTAVRNQLRERPLGGVEEVGLVEEVRARVARQAQFGEDGHLHARRRHLPQKRADGRKIGPHVRRTHRRHGRRDAQILVSFGFHDISSFRIPSRHAPEPASFVTAGQGRGKG